MKKSNFTTCIIMVLLLANLGWGCAASEKRRQPDKKRSPTPKLVYEDSGVQVYRRENGTIIWVPLWK